LKQEELKPVCHYKGREKIMQKRKKKDANLQKRVKNEKFFLCHVCGRELQTDVCIWQEDDAGMVCADCLAERESCGCSD